MTPALRVALTLSQRGSGGYSPIAWDGSSHFTATKGWNISWPLGFDSVNSWTSGTVWADYMAQDRGGVTRWATILATSADHARLPIDPTPMLRTDGSSAALAPLLAMVKTAIDDIRSKGLKCIVDMHVSFTDATYADAALVAGYNAQSSVWTKMKAVWLAVAKLCNTYATTAVALEIYNETASSTGTDGYVDMIDALGDYLRSIVGYRTTFLFAPPHYADPLGYAVAEFTASRFGANVGFAFHHYDPHTFTHQGVGDTTDPIYYFRNIPFPVTSDTRSAAISDMTAQVNSSGTLTSGQKTSIISQGTTLLNDHFDNYALTHDGYDGTQTVDQIHRWSDMFGSFETPPSNHGTSVEKWRNDNGVSAAAMFVTEMGFHLDYSREGANLADGVNWFTQSLRYLSTRGWSYSLWNEGDDYFSYRMDVPGGSYVPALGFDPLVTYAANLWVPSATWTPASLSSTDLALWLDGNDAATITASGGLVTQWSDKSGNARHGTAAGAARPATATGGVTTAAATYLATGLSASNDSEADFLVVNLPSATGDKTLLGPASSGGRRQFRVSNGDLQILRSGVANATGTSGGGHVPINQKTLLGVEIQVGAPTVYHANSLVLAGGTYSTSFGGAATTLIGRKDDGGETSNATYHEVISLTAKPAAWLAAQIKYYLNLKWTIY